MSTLIIEHCHLISGHSGREYVLSLLREKFWIVKASSAIRRVLSKCVSCRRRQRPVCEQKMADLPVDRLTPDQPPFTSVGVDYFVPFKVKRGRSLVKRYGVIFTCLAIRAVHIEVSHSLDTDSFLLALRRFIARRGQVKEIRSDNGTNFSSGEKEPHQRLESRENPRKPVAKKCQVVLQSPLWLALRRCLGAMYSYDSKDTSGAAPRADYRRRRPGHFNVRGGEHYEWPSNHDSL